MRSTFCITAALFISLLSTNGFANPPIPLTDCETIAQRGNYILENDLVLPEGTNGNCLVVDSSHVNVDLNGKTITTACAVTPFCPPFVQGAAGIDIEADHVSIENGQIGVFDRGFIEGIVGKADHISATNLNIVTDVGIVLNDTSYSSFTDIRYSGADSQYHASNGPVLSVTGGGHNTFTAVSGITGGGIFEVPGIVIESSSNNVIDGANITCGAEAEAGPGILLTQDSDNNFVTNNNVLVVFGNGIEVDLGSDYNVIQNNTVETIAPNGFFALLDQNQDCGSNIWSDNTFSSISLPPQVGASPASCIH